MHEVRGGKQIRRVDSVGTEVEALERFKMSDLASFAKDVALGSRIALRDVSQDARIRLGREAPVVPHVEPSAVTGAEGLKLFE